MTFLMKRRLLFSVAVLLTAAMYYGIFLAVSGAIDAALVTWTRVQ